jgi:putative endonuclease
MSKKKGYVYILANEGNSVLYVGVTSSLAKRGWEHKNDVVEGFTKKYRVHKLVYFEVLDSIEEAIEREKFIKGKSREFKTSLVESMNPEWKGLWEEIL